MIEGPESIVFLCETISSSVRQIKFIQFHVVLWEKKVKWHYHFFPQMAHKKSTSEAARRIYLALDKTKARPFAFKVMLKNFFSLNGMLSEFQFVFLNVFLLPLKFVLLDYLSTLPRRRRKEKRKKKLCRKPTAILNYKVSIRKKLAVNFDRMQWNVIT